MCFQSAISIQKLSERWVACLYGPTIILDLIIILIPIAHENLHISLGGPRDYKYNFIAQCSFNPFSYSKGGAV